MLEMTVKISFQIYVLNQVCFKTESNNFERNKKVRKHQTTSFQPNKNYYNFAKLHNYLYYNCLWDWLN